MNHRNLTKVRHFEEIREYLGNYNLCVPSPAGWTPRPRAEKIISRLEQLRDNPSIHASIFSCICSLVSEVHGQTRHVEQALWERWIRDQAPALRQKYGIESFTDAVASLKVGEP